MYVLVLYVMIINNYGNNVLIFYLVILVIYALYIRELMVRLGRNSIHLIRQTLVQKNSYLLFIFIHNQTLFTKI